MGSGLKAAVLLGLALLLLTALLVDFASEPLREAAVTPTEGADPDSPEVRNTEPATPSAAAARSPVEDPSHGRLHSARSEQRRRADRIRRAAAKNAARQTAPSHTSSKPSTAGSTPAEPAPSPPAPALTPEREQRQRDYVRRTVREQYFPVARSCYQELLDRDPQAGGRVSLAFEVVGYADAGVVDRVELTDETTIDDPEFELCMRESMYTTVFEPPPAGSERTTIVFPVELSP